MPSFPSRLVLVAPIGEVRDDAGASWLTTSSGEFGAWTGTGSSFSLGLLPPIVPNPPFFFLGSFLGCRPGSSGDFDTDGLLVRRSEGLGLGLGSESVSEAVVSSSVSFGNGAGFGDGLLGLAFCLGGGLLGLAGSGLLAGFGFNLGGVSCRCMELVDWILDFCFIRGVAYLKFIIVATCR